MPTPLPNYIGIGAPKAGTTWLARCLSEHPEVFMAAVKEVEFWKLADASTRLDEYREHFKDAEGKKALGEYSVRYLTLPGVPERLHAHLPEAKLIVALRNPVEQVTSNFWHLHRQNFNQPASQPGPQSIAQALETHRDFLLDPARYATSLARFYALFPREQIHVILFERIQQDPEGVLKDLFRFLGVDPAFQPPSTREKGSAVRQGTSPRSALAARLHKMTYGALVNWVYTPLKKALGTRRAATLKERLRIRPLMERLFMKKGYPAPTAAEMAALHAAFTGEITELERMTGLNLSSWK